MRPKSKPTFELTHAVRLHTLLRELDSREFGASAFSSFENGAHVCISSANDFVSRILIKRKWKFQGHGYPFQLFMTDDPQIAEATILDVEKAIAGIR